MNHLSTVALYAALGRTVLADKRLRDQRYLEANGWFCLGAEASTGEVHWTTLERGAGPGGPVTFYRALSLQRTADAIQRQHEEAKK